MGESVGWINLGDGTPRNGVQYSNTNGVDVGVNIEPDGALWGLAWGENIGWINFAGGALADPPQPARIDFASHRLRGYVWAENVGWINLDDNDHYVAMRCPGDLNGDGVLDLSDITVFVSGFLNQDPVSDIDGNGLHDLMDINLFVSLFLAGCQ
ncbi:MAG: hypothetical protein H6810_11515 [Phycisphaeraceae bacterium]|nr:MAG: hypothetical protein H6810_11515 [Phycisphaeraceae bacterium]